MIFVNAGVTFLESIIGKTLFPHNPIEAASSISASSFIAQTHITASGNISASGTVIADSVIADTGSFHVLKGDTTAATGLEVSGYISATNITASGNISASGEIIAASAYITNITSSGNISSSGNLIVSKSIQFSAGISEINFGNTAGGSDRFINAGMSYMNVEADDNLNLNADLRIYTNTPKFLIGTTTTTEARLMVAGDIKTVGTSGHITASGNISASGNLSLGDGTNLLGGKRLITSTDSYEFRDGKITALGGFITSQITASGNISASGEIIAASAYITNITASNNISASGTIFGTFQQITGITVSQASWTLDSGLYEYDISDASITSNTVVDVIPDNADYTIVLAAQLLPANVSSAGEVKIFAVNEPTDDINVTLNLFK
jgi:hypothetical protein